MGAPSTRERSSASDRLAELLGPLNLLVLMIPILAAGMGLASAAAKIVSTPSPADPTTDPRATIEPSNPTEVERSDAPALERARARSSANLADARELPLGYGL